MEEYSGFMIFTRLLFLLFLIFSVLIIPILDDEMGIRNPWKPKRKAKPQPSDAMRPINWCDPSQVYDRLYDALLSGDLTYIAHAAAALNKRLQWSGYSGIPGMRIRSAAHYQDWAKVDPRSFRKACRKDSDYRALLYFGSLHHNGYYREACLHAMADMPEALPWLLLGCNDWVPAVRRTAAQYVTALLPACSTEILTDALPCLDKLLRSQRCYADGMDPQTYVPFFIEGIRRSPHILLQRSRHIRHLAYGLLFREETADRALFHTFADQERDAFLHAFLVCRYIEADSAEDAELAEWLHDRSAQVRRAAAQKRYDTIGFWEGFTALLLDESRSIREFAAFHLRKARRFDLAGFYREQLCETCADAVLYGLGETGTEADAALLQPFLASAKPRTTAAALTALHGLQGGACAALLWEHLFHEAPMVRKTAYRLIVKEGLRFGASQIFDAIGTHPPCCRKYLVLLLTREATWERLPYLLQLYAPLRYDENERPDWYEEQNLQSRIFRAILERNPYARVSPALAGQIEAALSAHGDKLPEQVKHGILFDLEHVSYTIPI